MKLGKLLRRALVAVLRYEDDAAADTASRPIDRQLHAGEVADHYTEAARWLITWESDRLARVEARAGSTIAVAAIVIALTPTAIGSSSSEDGRWRTLGRLVGVVGAGICLLSILLALVFVLLPKGTAAPDTNWLLNNWSEARHRPGPTPNLEVAMADHILFGDEDGPAALEGFKEFVDTRTRWMKRATWVLFGALLATTSATGILALVPKEATVANSSNSTQPSKPSTPPKPVAPSQPRPGHEEHGGKPGGLETR